MDIHFEKYFEIPGSPNMIKISNSFGLSPSRDIIYCFAIVYVDQIFTSNLTDWFVFTQTNHVLPNIGNQNQEF